MRKLDTSERRDENGTGSGYDKLLHLPDIHVSFIILSAFLCVPTPIVIGHHFHFPARRESVGDNFCGSIQVQVPHSEEQLIVACASDDETCTARMEIPLQ